MRDVEETPFGPLDPQKEAMKRRVAEALIAADKELKPFAFDYKAIAKQLGISVHTAKFHVGSILDKLDATGRTDAVAHAARRGVIHL